MPSPFENFDWGEPERKKFGKPAASEAPSSGWTKDLVRETAIKYADQYGVPKDLILAQFKQESGFHPGLTSSAGAYGPAQLMPATAKSLGVDIKDPEQNIEGGVRLMKRLIEKYNGDYSLALAAYNAGEGNVKKHGGIPPFKETRNYVKNIMSQFGGKNAIANESDPEGDNLLKSLSERFGSGVPASPKQLQDIGVTNESLAEATTKAFSWGEYIPQQIAEGASLGIYEGEMSGRNIGEKAVGGAISLVSGIPTFALLSWGLGEAGLLFGLGKRAKTLVEGAKLAKAELKIAKGLSLTEKTAEVLGTAERLPALKSASRSAAFKSIKAEASKAALEGAYIGAGVEGVKSAAHGNDLEDVLIDSVSGAITWGGMGAALTPVMHGAGSFISRGRYSQLEKFGAQIGKEETTVKFLQDIKEKGSDELVNFLSKNADSLTPSQKSGLNAIAKIKELKPTFSANPEEVLAKPEIFGAYSKEFIDEAGKKLFLDPNNPISSLARTNPNIQELVNHGNFARAISFIPEKYNEILRNSKDVKDLLTAPLLLDSATVAEFKASKIISSSRKLGNLDGGDNLISSYYKTRDPDPLVMGMIDQTKERAVLEAKIKAGNVLPYLEMKKLTDLQRMASGADVLFGGEGAQFTTLKPAGLKSRITDKDLIYIKEFNPSLDSKKVESIVSDSIEKNFRAIAGEKFNLSDMSHFNDVDKLARTMLPLNKSVFNTISGTLQVNNGQLKDDFVYIRPELKDLTKKIIEKNAYEAELRDEYSKLQFIKRKEDPQLRRFYSGYSDEEFKKWDAWDVRDDLKTVSSAYKRIADRVSKIKEIETSIQGTEQAKLLEATKLADQAYLPNKKDIGSPLTQDFFDKIGFKDSPYLLKNNSELADFLHGLNIAGHETKLRGAFSPENLIRQTRRSFGYNNPLEKFFNQYKEVALKKNDHVNRKMKEISSLGIPKKSDMAYMASKYVEGSINDSSPEFLSLNPNVREKIKQTASYARSFFDEHIGLINDQAKALNMPMIPVRKNYVHHPRSLASYPQMLKEWITASPNDKMKMVDKDGFFIPNPTAEREAMKTFAAFEKRRKGTGDKDFDIIESMERYLDPAANRIFYQDLIRQVDTAKVWAESGTQDVLQKFKDLYLLGETHGIDKFLFRNDLGKATARAIDKARQKFSQSALLGSASTLTRQLTSIPSNFGLSTKEATTSIFTMWNKEAKLRWAESSNRKFRNQVTEGNDVVEMKNVFDKIKGGALKTGYEKYKAFLEAALNITDDIAARHAYETGYQYFKGVEGLPDQYARKGAEWWVDATQANMSKLNQPEWNRSVIGRTVSQFQTFTTNFFGTIINDIPNLAATDGAAKATVMMLRGMAAINLANETLQEAGLPAAYDAGSYIPILSSGYGMGISGPAGTAWDAGKYAWSYLTNNDRLRREAKRELSYEAPNLLGFPGGGQIAKTARYLSDDGKKTIRGTVFGKASDRQLEEAKKKQRKRERGQQGFIRGKTEEFIKGL